jgi:endonuclease/exonuclease/phosphatase family metal-dependent hydrolase
MLRLGTGNMRFGHPAEWEVPNPQAFSEMPTTLFVDAVRARDLDVVLIQEVYEDHVVAIANYLSRAYYRFVPMHHIHLEAGQLNRIGLAIFSRYPLDEYAWTYYGLFNELLPGDWDSGSYGGKPALVVFQQAQVSIGGVKYRLGQTHFSWTPGGKFLPHQQIHLRNLLAIIGDEPIVWGGDLNMPRATSPGWQMITERFADNIPATVLSTLDPVFHPAVFRQGKQFVLDGLFSTSPYRVSRVELVTGVSDHILVTATVDRN